MRALTEYSDSSHCSVIPGPLTDHKFLGLSKFENEDFKIWLALICVDEIEVSQDRQLEISLIQSFKEQLSPSKTTTPAQRAKAMSFWVYQADADKAWAGLAYGCEFWQLVQHVPTLDEFNSAYPELVLDFDPPMQPIIKTKSTKSKVIQVQDAYTIDLFGEIA
ncbi:hypothetical protein [Acinetobacter sp. ANC5681]|uniref:hypothetical protein n=1 Tax=Acinetobacter sp. ANC5681 TaxID=2929504 RepID=UPI00201AE67C|nr:hypothetical protein [Acinetobacter sp. ANC5681]MCL5767382.1 hypothetical protein [Acinetobacter sp. ANC5681]